MFIHKVCDTLEKAQIPYAIVGGYAVALHGIPRGTFDVDFVITWSLQNLEKTEKALQAIGLVSRIPVNAKNIFTFRDEYIQNKQLIAWNFYDPIHPINQVDIIINYNLEGSSTKTIKTSHGKVKILSREALIIMKKASGRPQDLEDVKSLEQI